MRTLPSSSVVAECPARAVSSDGPAAAVFSYGSYRYTELRGDEPSNPPAITSRPSYSNAAAWPGCARTSTDSGSVGASGVNTAVSGSNISSEPASSPPATTTRPSYINAEDAPARPTDIAPVAFHVFAGTSGGDALRSRPRNAITAATPAVNTIERFAVFVVISSWSALYRVCEQHSSRSRLASARPAFPPRNVRVRNEFSGVLCRSYGWVCLRKKGTDQLMQM